MVPSNPLPKVLIHNMGLTVCKLSSISSNKSVSWSYCKWDFCILETVACNWELSKGRLLWTHPLKCLDNWSQVYALWLYLWGVTRSEEKPQSHLRWICNCKFCTLSSSRRAAFSKPTHLSLIARSMRVWLPRQNLRLGALLFKCACSCGWTQRCPGYCWGQGCSNNSHNSCSKGSNKPLGML